jgi:hypothetical protein
MNKASEAVEDMSGKLFESYCKYSGRCAKGTLAKSFKLALSQSDASYCIIDDLSITYSAVKTDLASYCAMEN